MDRDDLNLAYAAADEENDSGRLEELRRAEQNRSVGDLEYKYLDSEGRGTDGQSDLQSRAEQSLSMAVDEGLEDSLRSVADAQDPQRVLREEIAYNEGRNPDRADALRQLAEGDE
jgi:hypothetical protein